MIARFLFAFLFFFNLYANASQKICPGIQIEGAFISLNDVQRRLVCGDDTKQGIIGQTWATIPHTQSQFHLTAVLQSNGYLKPKFKEVEGTLTVFTGNRSYVSKLNAEGLPPEVSVHEKRKVIGAPLTPQILNEVESWAKETLQEKGYPCPKISSIANEDNGEVILKVNSGAKQKILKINQQPVYGLRDSTLRRYDAFRPGDFYDTRNLILTERRVMADDIVSTHLLETDCKVEGVEVNEKVILGDPRFIRAGFGVNTEQGPLTRLTWRYSRTDTRASSVNVTILAGLNTQELTSTFRYYYLDKPSRHYLSPNLRLSHEKEQYYESNTAVVGLMPGWTGDSDNHHWEIEVGPNLRQDKTTVGVGPTDSHQLLIDSHFGLQSHTYEYYQSNPKEGSRLLLGASFSSKEVASSISAQKLTLFYEHLFNYQNYSPPLWIFGLRSGFNTTLVQDSSVETAQLLPPAFRYYLGGSSDIRGFGRKELPGRQEGSLTSGYVGTEARWCYLPYEIQPFLFLDGGAMGSTSGTLSAPFYWSPGFGLRWGSPIGAFRLEAAHGYLYSSSGNVDSPLSHYQFYLAYGEEF